MPLNIAPREGDSPAYEALVDIVYRAGVAQSAFPPGYRMQPSMDLLRVVQLLKAAAADLERRTVLDYRENGAPWTTIAWELGVSRQAVQKRFGASS